MPVFQLETQDGRKFEVEAPDIQSASKTLEDHADHPSFLRQATKPITDIPAEYTGMVDDAVNRMGRGVGEIAKGDVIKGAANTGVGALDYLTAPINAPIHSIVGKPIENVTGSKEAGNLADLAASVLLPVPKGIPRLGGAAATAEKAAPTVHELDAAAKAGFQNPAVTELSLKPSAMKTWADGVRTSLTDAGIDENLAPKTWSVLKGLDSAPGNAIVTGKNLQSLRRVLGRAAGLPDATERSAAQRGINALDNFIAGGIPQDAILRGDPAKAAAAWNDARGNYAAARRSEKVSDAVENAELQAGSAHSGQNIDNATRQKIKAILANPKARRGYSGDELRQMKRVVMGTFTGDAARFVSNIFGKGGGLGALAASATGAATGAKLYGLQGAALGAAAPVIGFGFAELSNAITAREIGKLQTLIRSRSPLAQQMKGPLESWGKTVQAFEKSRTPQNVARLVLASRNLANNLKDAGIVTSTESLIGSLQGPTPTEASPEAKGDKLPAATQQRAAPERNSADQQ